MLLPFQGVTAPTRGTQGVAALALGYVLHWAFSPPLLNPKLHKNGIKKHHKSTQSTTKYHQHLRLSYLCIRKVENIMNRTKPEEIPKI